MVKKTTNSKTFGSYIRELRTNKEIGQRELAKKIGVAPSYLNDMEKNKRDDKRFCDPVCKNKYHSYKRSYAGILIDTGQLDFQTVKKLIEKNY